MKKMRIFEAPFIFYFYNDATASGVFGPIHQAEDSRAAELCTRFITLLSQAKGKKRTIGWFAEELCISSHYLSMAVKESSGQSVKSIIDNAVITEMKVLLRHSDLSVSQIADRLEFPNSSFMCKYFKAKTGITPLNYRHGR